MENLQSGGSRPEPFLIITLVLGYKDSGWKTKSAFKKTFHLNKMRHPFMNHELLKTEGGRKERMIKRWGTNQEQKPDAVFRWRVLNVRN